MKAPSVGDLFELKPIEAEPGYWAVEIRMADASAQGARHLCHAENDRAACNMAGRLMSSSRAVIGFDSFWIDERLLQKTRLFLPELGGHQRVASEGEWARLIGAHQASEAADLDRRRPAAAAQLDLR